MNKTSTFMVVLLAAIVNSLLFGCLGPGPAIEPEQSLKNVAAAQNGGTASAQDYGTYMGTSMIPSRVNDDDLETDWAGMKMPAWCQVEFDQQYTIKRLRCVANYHTQTYKLQLSQDGERWETVASHTTPNNAESGNCEGYDDFSIVIAPTPARYARVLVTATDAPVSHIYQAIISELQAFAE